MLKKLSVFAGALLLTGMLAQSASAALTYNFTLAAPTASIQAGATGATATTISAVGSPITVYMYAKVTGSNAAGYQALGTAEVNVLSHKTGNGASSAGDWTLTTAALGGALGVGGGVSVKSAFQNNGFSAGQVTDLNADGINDVGTFDPATGNDKLHPGYRNKYANNTSTGVYGLQKTNGAWDLSGVQVPVAGATAYFYLGSAVFTPSGSLGSGSTQFSPDLTGVATIGMWFQDVTGVTDALGDGSEWDTTGGTQFVNGGTGATILAGSSVTISTPVPEPATLGLLALGALLALRRRNA
jgi:hypothetical protein